MRKLTGRGLETLSGRPVSGKWLELRCEPRFTWLWTLQSWLCTILATEGWKESALDLIGLLFLANTKQSSLSYIGGEALVQIDLLMSCLLSCFSCVWLFVILWTVARQALLPMGFSRQKYWSGLPFPPPKDLSDPGIKPKSLLSPALAGGFFTASTTWEGSSFIWSLLIVLCRLGHIK